jgi:hypothetical protein
MSCHEGWYNSNVLLVINLKFLDNFKEHHFAFKVETITRLHLESLDTAQNEFVEILFVNLVQISEISLLSDMFN